MKHRVVSSVLLLALLLPVQASRADPLVNPAPILVPAGVDQGTVVKAIKQALMYRNWMISAQQPGRIDAKLYLRGNEADIRIDYDGSSVRIAYAGSRGLEEHDEKGVRQIHGRYPVWINYLIGDIDTNLRHSPRQG